jgi:hypothetical protein
VPEFFTGLQLFRADASVGHIIRPSHSNKSNFVSRRGRYEASAACEESDGNQHMVNMRLFRLICCMIFVAAHCASAKAQVSGSIPDVTYGGVCIGMHACSADNTGVALTEAETWQLSNSLTWDDNFITFGVGDSARAELKDGAGQTLASVKVTWNSVDQRVICVPADNCSSAPPGSVNAPAGAGPKTKTTKGKTTPTSVPKVWFGTFTLELTNKSTCSFRPDGKIQLAGGDTYIVDGVAWSGWRILHDPAPGKQDSVQHDFIVPTSGALVVLRLGAPDRFSPLWSCTRRKHIALAKKRPTSSPPPPAPVDEESGPPATAAAAPRSCDWSSEFDQIRNQQVLSSMRQDAQNGRSVAQQTRQSGLSVQQLLNSGEQSLSQLAAHLEQVKAAIQDVSSPPVTDFNFTFDYQATCINANSDMTNNALLAAECEYVNTEDMIHTTEGAIDVYRCMLGN